ncbi:hypothetical protein FACS1894147_10560 [Spirochaetia bacterium]|nr:hypothetical protein FACS1894147_10560 [Spirochaetia bacterium]
MKKNKFFMAGMLAVLLALVFAACGGDYSGNAYKRVDSGLRGRWERTEPTLPWYETQTPVIVFTSDTIRIEGTVTHLSGITRNTSLEAYTENTEAGTLLYIKDKGAWQSPVEYTRWESGGAYPRDQFITLKGGGGVDETFKQVVE